MFALKWVLIYLYVGVATYLLFAFGTWQFNPAEWGDEARVACTITCFCEQLAIIFSFMDDLKRKKRE